MKRTMDILVSSIGVIVIFPLLLILSLLILLNLGSPVFFTQVRPGRHGKPFRMIKFRTMTNEKDDDGTLLPNEKRMTRFGSFLRSASLDELPELFNVLIGDMSLVGPRPLLMDYLPWFSEEQNRRHNVKPGITGWSQINGRNAIEWDKKLELDAWYVDNQSLMLDIKILMMTVSKVIKRDGITYDGHVAMPRFDEYVKEKNSEL